MTGHEEKGNGHEIFQSTTVVKNVDIGVSSHEFKAQLCYLLTVVLGKLHHLLVF